MKTIHLLILLSSFTTNIFAAQLVRQSSCQPAAADEPAIFNEDFSWDTTLENLRMRAQELYVSPKRLEKRAYINKDGQVVIPIESYSNGLQEVKITERFIKSVRLHIEEALKRKYIDAVIFSDMGHSHFFIPQEFYDRELASIPSAMKNELFEKMLAHEGLKILYHTAEQLKMKEESGEFIKDRHVQWRFFTRNLVGDNKAQGKLELLHSQEHSHNTAHDYDPGYKYWGGGFYVSANVEGCFPFQHGGKTYYFDLNLDGIRPGTPYSYSYE